MSKTVVSPTVWSEPDDILGEVPIWVAEESALYWIDVRRPALRRLNYLTGKTDVWVMPTLIGSFAVREGGGLLVALRDRIATFDLVTGQFETVAAPHSDKVDFRFNDGACDRQGRFWVGSMDDRLRTPVGTLYRIDRTGCTPVLGGVAVSNSLCWSPDGRTMYFADGVDTVIWAFDYDPRSGTISNRREFARTPPNHLPDGATVDAAGCVWCALYGGSVVNRYAPTGDCVLTIPLEVSLPTCVAFGGPKLTTLFITTARQRLAPEVLASQPLAGSLLSIETDVVGLPEPRFAG